MVDESELLPGARIPSRLLTGDDEREHIDMLTQALRGARLNAYFPDARALISHLQVLSPQAHGGIYPGLEIDVRTGLPTYKEWTRAQTDVRLAVAQLEQLPPRHVLVARAAQDPGGPHARQLGRRDYYTAIQDATLVPLGDMRIQLRRVDYRTSVAHFHVILDKLDASGVFVRYAIDVAQRQDSVDRIASVDPGDVASHTKDFQALVYQFTSLDSEFTFIKLASMAGLQVERVIKGVIGPVFTPWTRNPPGWEALCSPFLATFAQDMAAMDVLEFRDNDPLSSWWSARRDTTDTAYEGMRGTLRYQVFKDRKFVCERSQIARLRAHLASIDAKNIVYGV